MLFVTFGVAASPYETPENLEARNVLPAELYEGEHFIVDDTVRNDGYLNYYHIKSDFGELDATGTTMLMTRIAEVNAIAELEEPSRSKVFIKAAADAGVTQLKTLQQFSTRPVETVKGILPTTRGFESC